MVEIKAVDRQQAFRYMGLHGAPDGYMLQMADTCEQKLLSAVQPNYCWQLFAKADIAFILQGQDIKRHLQACEQVVLFCATLSQGADTCIRKMQANDVFAGVMTDAMASALTEQLCDFAEQEILSHFPGKYATWRFSAGYGDLPLHIQSDFLNMIQAEKRVGVCVSKNHILLPRKSVTAIIGISDKPLETRRKGCAACNLAKTCPYRAKGVHCN